MRPLNFFASIGIVLTFALCAPQVSSAQYSISTIAGGGPNGLTAANTSIGYPESIAFDAAGNAYIAQSYASQILKVSATGTVTVVAGNGTSGYSGDGGPASSAALNEPQGVFVDSSGNIFIADTENSVIREVVVSTGNIQTVVGVNYDASDGSACQSGGDGGPALSAHLCLPYSVFVDGSGNIFIADFGNSTIREVVAGTGNIQTVAGTPGTPGYIDGVLATSAELDLPASVFVDASGNIIIADTFNSVIRVVNPSAQAVIIAGTAIQPGFITTVAGSQYDSKEGSECQSTGDGGPALSAFLCEPFGVFVDTSDNIYVADYANFAIREVLAAGTISTVAGTLGSDCQTYATSGCGNGASAIVPTAQLNYPSGVTLNSGNIFIADTEDFVVREVTGGNIQAFAGNATEAYSGDGGLATIAELNDPGAVFVDGSGNVFIADTSNSVIREVLTSTGNIQTVAGNGVAGDSGVGVAPTTAELNLPGGVFVDAAGDIFIADTTNSAIREVVASTGLIQTLAGTLGTAGYSGDGGVAASALLSNPNAVVVDGSGNIYIADTANSAIRVVNTGTAQITVAGVAIPAGDIQTVAGIPTKTCDDDTSPGCGDGGPAISAYLNFPAGLALDAAGDIFIADTFDNAIRQVSATTGTIQTVAGTIGATGGFSGDGAAATSALLDSPSGVFIDASGDIFIADSDNAAIREVVAATGFIQTIAGIPATTGGFPTPGFSGDGGPATSAELNSPSGVFGTSAGNLYIADTNNSRIRELTSSPAPSAASPAPQTVAPGGTATFSLTLNPYTGKPQPITLSCLQSSLPSGATCTFSPSTVTPGSSSVPFTLAVAVPSTSASLRQSRPGWLGPQMCVAFLPLAGLFLLGKKSPNQRWLWLALLSIFLLALVACGGGTGGGSSTTTPPSTTYSIQIQGTTSTQPKPVTITTASLTVQ